jgi:hypothetical protein
MRLKLTDEANEVTERVVLITGAMRTGSTLFGRLLRSMVKIEVFHEPGVIYTLFPQINDLSAESWRLLFSVSIFEDCLIRSLNATAFNMNEADESWVGHSLSSEEITARMSCRLDHEALLQKALEFTVCIKVPEMLPYLEQYRRLYPDSQIIVTLRKPERVIASLLRKGYYSDERLFQRPKKWPNRVIHGKAYPFWLPDDKDHEWEHLSEIERCCLAYCFQYDSYVHHTDDLIVDYDELCRDPKSYWGMISEEHDWINGPRTERLLSTIEEPTVSINAIMSGLDTRLYEAVIASYERVKAVCSQIRPESGH